MEKIFQNSFKKIYKIIKAKPQIDGDGVKLFRTIGSASLSELDPFLLLDEFKSDDPKDYIGGFPNHPHRGFETVTYLLKGEMAHKDSEGNQGILQAGGAQWMTAGHGVIHSEMPRQKYGLLQGFQLWLNLPKIDKMQKPKYQDIGPSQLNWVDQKDYKFKLISGNYLNYEGPVSVNKKIDPLYLDIEQNPNTEIQFEIKNKYNSFIYLYQGNNLKLNGGNLNCNQLAVFDLEGSLIRIRSQQEGYVKYLILSARPIGEPIVRQGPFVMNTYEEIEQAFQEYQNGTLTQIK